MPDYDVVNTLLIDEMLSVPPIKVIATMSTWMRGLLIRALVGDGLRGSVLCFFGACLSILARRVAETRTSSRDLMLIRWSEVSSLQHSDRWRSFPETG